MTINDTPINLQSIDNMLKKDYEQLVQDLRDNRVAAGIAYKKEVERAKAAKQDKITKRFWKQATMIEKDMEYVDKKLLKITDRLLKVRELELELEEEGVLQYSTNVI